jgi:hypothetical protein
VHNVFCMNNTTNEHKIWEALDIAIERLEDDFYDTQTETWSEYGVEYAHARLRFVQEELRKKFKINLQN